MSNVLKIAGAGVSAAAVPSDADFENTVLLLHGDGTNGAQNNTFLDASTNNFTITRNGNTTQGTFTPFSKPDGRWGNFFDGTNDRLTIADNAALRPGTSNFTIEAWVYRAAAGAAHTIFAKGGASTGFVFGITSGNVLRFTHTTTNIDSTGTVAANAWVHVAVVREGTGTNQVKLYINGVADGQGTVSTDFNQTEEARIGENRGATDDFNGYISNFRYVIGSAIYTGNFTPSTAPLTTTSQGASSSEVELLTCQSNRFIDNSTNAFTVTPVNNARVTPFSPFPITTAYDPSVNGGAGYFDGSGDSLSVANNSALSITGNVNASIEFWVYPISGDGAVVNKSGVSGSVFANYSVNVNANGSISFFLGNSGSPGSAQNTLTTSAGTVPFNAWSHVVCTKTYVGGGAVNLYRVMINGILSNNNSQNNASDGNPGALTIGFEPSSALDINAYISQLRIFNTSIPAAYQTSSTTNGTSIYTVPTTPITASTSSICTLFTNAGIFDNTGFNALETVADAQIDTTVKKYGTGSMEFDGTGDWLKVPDTIDLRLGTGNFTIEFWVYLATGDIGSNRGLVAKGGASTGFLVSLNTTEKVVFTFTTSTITSSGAITTNAWNHIAVVREGTGSNQTKIYINGTNDGTGTVSTDFTQTEIMYIGANRTAGDPMKGFIDDLRITKGIARYTTTFTPPTAAFPDL